MPFCGATGILSFGLRITLPMSFKVRVDQSSCALFCRLRAMILRVNWGSRDFSTRMCLQKIAGCQLKPIKPFKPIFWPSYLLNLFNCQKAYLNLFFLAVKTFFFFFWKMSHFILFLAGFPLILVFYSLFNHHYSTQEHSLEILSLTLLGIFFVQIMLEFIFFFTPSLVRGLLSK